MKNLHPCAADGTKLQGVGANTLTHTCNEKSYFIRCNPLIDCIHEQLLSTLDFIFIKGDLFLCSFLE